MNVALTVAETAYFMEKGEIRFNGPTTELLERPDVLRSVFLEGPAASSRRRRRRLVHVTATGRRRSDRRRRTQGRASRSPRRVEALRRHRGARRRLVRRVRPARSSASSARTAPARPRSSTSLSGFQAPAAGDIDLEGTDITTFDPTRARLGTRAVVPGRAALPRPHRRGDDRRGARAQHRGARSVGGAALHLPSVRGLGGRRWPNASRSSSSCWASARSATSTSASCPPVVGASSTSPACWLTGPAVLLLDEPSSGIAQREAEALGPLLLRIRDDRGEAAHHRARHPAAHRRSRIG